MKETMSKVDLIKCPHFMMILFKEFDLLWAYDSERIMKQHGIKEVELKDGVLTVEYMSDEEHEGLKYQSFEKYKEEILT